MENLFDALCSALAEPSVKQLFLDGEGVELMIILMKCASVVLFFDRDYVERNCTESESWPRLGPSRSSITP
jgi:hypothetical protein